MKLKLSDISNPEYKTKNYKLPQYDINKVRKNTHKNPTWIHFGAGNIFRAFLAKLQQHLLNQKLTDKGIIVAEGFDYEIIDKIFKPYDLLTLAVELKSDGTVDKEVIASMTEGLKFDPMFKDDFKRLVTVFENDSLEIASFTITEKGYELKNNQNQYYPLVLDDFKNGTKEPKSYLGKVVYLLLKRFNKNKKPLTLVSMDNYSHNGTKLKNSILDIAKNWEKENLVGKDFIDYLENSISYPWTMIDKITPRPDEKVAQLLKQENFLDIETIVTEKHTYVAPYVNAEETEYLVVEDNFKNGRPSLEKVGVIFTTQETVDKVEKMKVSTCLNPLHTALAIYGCLLGFTKISDEMKDPALVSMIKKIGYEEGLKVVVDPKIINPKAFIDQVINKRLPNPFMPDTPQRIATDTSQKISIRFGQTIKAYIKDPNLDEKDLKVIPLVLAGWIRYLMGIDDAGNKFTVSPDPLYPELYEHVKDIKLGDKIHLEKIEYLLADEKVFGLDLTKTQLAPMIIDYFNELNQGKNAVKRTLDKYLL
ncbi:Mannitol-1-phosphate/altronate dehydrogenases [Alteracholeplasma palmae J233]|uniref:Mannitol-1-phosphate/altronate dehydrogenases n=1 Tax=Alteracholeplasma palmae (strain ATCC 49389 / J233) TaxID=1318466 RepID=U4KKA8_ALTPJ|nr:mannitol dehydrogenase family protein [Alteracholeplasma palmae]CCV63958.1 Mannitol-1-phosphate/altronate dehydrogenases [Alteracholeplasma palmae J233]